AQYLALLRELQQAHGLALIFITHNLGIVAKMCDRLVVMYAGRVIEAGPVRQIFAAPAHPYTEALLNSIPQLGVGRRRLAAIAGRPPAPAQPAPGCAFAPRCAKVIDVCRTKPPPQSGLGNGHCVCCWRAPAKAGAGAHSFDGGTA